MQTDTPRHRGPQRHKKHRTSRRREGQNLTRRLVVSAAMLAGIAAAGASGTYAAFSATTDNAGNTFAAGTVEITDNDVSAAMFSMANARHSTPESGCVQVTYTGTLPSQVVLHGAVTGLLATKINLVVTRGTDPAPTFDSCTGFTADAANHKGLGPGILYSGTLAAYPATFAAGIVDPTPAWATGEKHSYRYTVTINNDNTAQGQSAGATFSWEARI